MRRLFPLLWLLLCSACPESPRSVAPVVEHELTSVERVAEALARFHRSATPSGAPSAAMRQALQLISRGDRTQARALLEPLSANGPEAARASFLVGYTLHKEQRYAEARPWIERALELGPNFERSQAVFYIYGWCLWNLGEPLAARAAFEAYLEFDPRERDAYFALGLIALDQGEIDEARGQLEHSIALTEELRATDPRDAQLARDLAKAFNALADVDLAHEDLQAARARLERSVALHRDGYEAWFKLSRVLTRLGENEAAAHAREQHDAARARLGR